MKKLLTLLLVFCMALNVLAACTPADNTNDPENTNPPANVENPGDHTDSSGEEPKKEIHYVQTYPYTDEAGALHIRYQDTYTFENMVAGVENVVITSTVCGSEEADNAVIERVGEYGIKAVGCGSAKIVFRRENVKVVVDPSPINLLFVTGQSNASADWSFYGNTPEAIEYGPTYSKHYIRTAPTMAYFTWTGQWLSIAKKSGTFVAKECVPDSLNWDVIKRQNYVGCNPTVLANENSGFGQAGWCAALAHEWVEQTGERIWIVNASHGGMPISTFLPTQDGMPVDNDYYQALSVFRLALETIYREVDAGHFVLNHMAYYWFQGESDSSLDDAYYLQQFEKVHTGFQQDVVYQHNGLEKKLEYCGIMTLRSCRDSTGNSNDELYMTGPRLAQYYMGGAKEGVFSNVFIASNVTEKWVGGDENVENYFLDTYGSKEAFYEIFGYDMPTTMFEVHPNIHYLMKGHNEMGMDAARNSLRIINETQPEKNYRLSYPEEEKVSVTLLLLDGVSVLGDTILLDEEKGMYIFPSISPAYAISRGVELRAETEGFAFEGYLLKLTGARLPNTFTFSLFVAGKHYQTYTVKVMSASPFLQNFPQFSRLENGAYTFLGNSGPWHCGYYTYNTKRFTEFTDIQEDGWLYDGKLLWGNGSQGAFWITNGMKVGLSSYSASCSAIEYRAPADGTIGVFAELFSPNLNSVYLAIAVNGKMVWPVEGGALMDYANNWYLAKKNQDCATTLNAAWETLSISVQSGDSITFLLRYVNGVGQTTLYPTVYYKEQDA